MRVCVIVKMVQVTCNNIVVGRGRNRCIVNLFLAFHYPLTLSFQLTASGGMSIRYAPALCR